MKHQSQFDSHPRQHRGNGSGARHNQQQQSPDPHSRLAMIAHERGIPPPPPQVVANTALWAQMMAMRQPHFDAMDPFHAAAAAAAVAAGAGYFPSPGTNAVHHQHHHGIGADFHSPIPTAAAAASRFQHTMPHPHQQPFAPQTPPLKGASGGGPAAAAHGLPSPGTGFNPHAAGFDPVEMLKRCQREQFNEHLRRSMAPPHAAPSGSAAANSSSPHKTPAGASPPPAAAAAGAAAVDSKPRSEVELQLLAMPHESVVEILAQLCALHRDAKSYTEACIHRFQLTCATMPIHGAALPSVAAHEGDAPARAADGAGHVTPRRALKFGDDAEPADEAHDCGNGEGDAKSGAHDERRQKPPLEQGGSCDGSSDIAADDNEQQQQQQLAAADSTATTTTVTAAAAPVAEPQEENLVCDAAGARYRADERPFSRRLHPCVCTWSVCRYAKSCLLADCPGNVCLNWLRGQCNAGNECLNVHRLPPGNNAVAELFKACHS